MSTTCDVGDIVFALDKGSLYEAKILKAQVFGSKVAYFIHFQGWARKFDTWIDGANCCMKGDEKNRQRLLGMEAPKDDKGKNKGKKARSKKGDSMNKDSSDAPKSPAAGQAPGEGEAANSAADDDTSLTKVEKTEENTDEKPLSFVHQNKRKSEDARIADLREATKRNRKLAEQDLMIDIDDGAYTVRIEIPLPLKRHLVDEWGLITKEPKRLMKLPKKENLTVKSIMTAYMNDKRGKKAVGNDTTDVKDILDGFCMYFDLALPRVLLYRWERDQYNRMKEAYPNMRACELYGCEHLLRIYTRLPRLLSGVFMDPAEFDPIIAQLMDVLKYIDRNASKFIQIQKYEIAADVMAEGFEAAAADEESATAGKKE
jgi:mortality factor 4-like protein 1